MVLTESQRKIIARLSMAAQAIDPRNPRPEAVMLLKELNDEFEKAMDASLTQKNVTLK